MAAIVLFTDYDHCFYEALLEAYKYILPQEVKEKAKRFRRWQDRQAFILGKLLVWKGLKDQNYEDDCLGKIQLNSFGKPYVDPPVFFNLSHSGKYVLCAFSKDEVGIDIEEVRPIETNDFASIFSEQEKKHLRTTSTPLKDFFRFWTIKESVIKAIGNGLSIPLPLINALEGGVISVENASWYFEEIPIFKNYCCSIASSARLTSILVEKVNFENGSLKPEGKAKFLL